VKQIAKKIAMILIIVLIVNCFTGCQIVGAIFAGMLIYAVAIGVGTLIVAGVIALVVTGIQDNIQIKERGPRRTNPYLYENKTITETISSLPQEDIDSLSKTLSSMSKKELNSIIGKLNSISEEERISLMDSINSFSVQELGAIVETFNSMSETEINTSIESLNSLPETVSLTSIVQDLEVDVSGEKALVKQRSRY
jgi:hypothetical protein